MPHTNYEVRNVGKAAKVYAELTGEILVRFPERVHKMRSTLRHRPPIITKDGITGVRCANGIWRLSASAHLHREEDGTPLRNHATGRYYKATIAFAAHHVLWLDEQPKRMSRKAIENAIANDWWNKARVRGQGSLSREAMTAGGMK